LLSHQLITGQFIHIRVANKSALNEKTTRVSKETIKNYPFPKLINQYVSGLFAEKK